METSLCKTCGAPVVKFIKSTNKWWDWCSNKCMGADPAILEKKKQTNLKKCKLLIKIMKKMGNKVYFKKF